MSLILILGCLAAGLTLGSFFMKTMNPPPVVAIAADVSFIMYATLSGAWHVLALHRVLLPFNVLRLVESRRLTEKVREASQGDLDMAWLRPFMSRVWFLLSATHEPSLVPRCPEARGQNRRGRLMRA